MSAAVLLTYRFEEKAPPYRRALALAGLSPVDATPATRVSLEGISGLCVSGGSDIDPSRYGQLPGPLTRECDPERDAFEADLLERAIRASIPVLAICRGMQLLNVVRGGSLVQHIEGHVFRPADAGQPAHEVDLVRGSALESIFAGERTLRVNSRHHQVIGSLGAGLSISARSAADSLIEGVDLDGTAFVAGVQWHPEDQAPADPLQLRLFTAFASASRESAGSRHR